MCAIQDKVYTVRYTKDMENKRRIEKKIQKNKGIATSRKPRRRNRTPREIKEEIVFNYLSSKKLITFYHNLLTIARNNISINPLIKDEFNRFSFFYSIRALQDTMNKMSSYKNYSRAIIQDNLKALANIGIIEYAPINKLSDSAKEKALMYKKKNGFKYHINFFIINNILYEEVITNIANNIEELKTLRNKSIRNMSFEQVYRSLGKEAAYKMYPQLIGKTIELEDKNYKHIKKVAIKLLNNNDNGFFTEDMLKKSMNKNITVKEKEKLIKKYMNQLINDLGITYTKANKKVKENFPAIPDTITNKQFVYVKMNDKTIK